MNNACIGTYNPSTMPVQLVCETLQCIHYTKSHMLLFLYLSTSLLLHVILLLTTKVFDGACGYSGIAM